MNKTVHSIYSPPATHWVGDGFPVKTLFNYQQHGPQISPFLLLDHAGPQHFAPTDAPQGVGSHPHRGFETVTIVYSGAVSHRDTTGAGGTIGPGEVQWMTAGRGLLHEEFHAPSFAKEGGLLEMVQLWVNLPAAHKMTAPRYQALTHDNIPEVRLPEDAGVVRVIAGDYNGHQGAARTYSPINVWDVRLRAQADAMLELPAQHTLLVLVVHGTAHINGARVQAGQWAHLSREGCLLMLQTEGTACDVLVLGGAPIDEPIVGQGPFVMNTRAELAQAFGDFYAGQFGVMPTAAPATAP